MTPKEFWKANNRMFDFCVTSFSQSSFLDFFQTSWPDFIPWDLCWNQTARQFSDRFAKTAEGVIHCLHVYLQWSRKKKKSPEGHQWKKDQALTRGIIFIRLPPLNYLHLSWVKPVISWSLPNTLFIFTPIPWGTFDISMGLISESPDHKLHLSSNCVKLPHFSFPIIIHESEC